MVGGRVLKAQTEYINAFVPPLVLTNRDQTESGYGSTNSNSDDSPKYERTRTARLLERRPQMPTPTVNMYRAKSAFNTARRSESVRSAHAKQQQPVQTARTEQTLLKNTAVSLERYRKNHILVKKEYEVVDYSDDWDSDYSDHEVMIPKQLSKPTAARPSSMLRTETSSNTIGLTPSDPTAFDASFCRQRQEAIDNMAYRQAINSWTAKRLPDVLKLITELSAGKSLIDRAWIIFYWISQNIEYDVQAFFSGNIRHQTAEDIFTSGKGVCDGFGTVFQTLCNALQIQCEKIGGYPKGYGFQIEQKSFDRTDHAWNAIHIERHWYLVDSTWGEGHLDHNNCNKKELRPFYFLVRPEQLIYSHLPENSKWQLLVSPISMKDFLRLPKVYATFFELNLDIVYPHHSNMASCNSVLGFAEVLVRAPLDIRLIGSIKQTRSSDIENAALVQYDTDHQLWQCCFAPNDNGFYILTLFARSERKETKSKTDKNTYSSAIQFGLHMKSDIIQRKTFPLTYGLFTERKCQIFEPLDGVLKSGSKVTIHCRIPGAYCARLALDGNWLSEDIIKDDIFKREITVPKSKITLYVQFSNKKNSSSYDGLFCYSVK